MDICVSKNLNLKWQDVVFADCKQLSTAVKTLWTSDLYHTLYRRKFLTDENIQVNNYSKISGFEFYCKSVLKAERIGFIRNLFIMYGIFGQRTGWKHKRLNFYYRELMQ